MQENWAQTSNAKGAGIESAARKQLKLLLPQILDVGQGYIIDSYGNISKQIDLVIFERSLCPVFSINESPESTYYPCEGVVAAIEIKSRTGKREFMDSCEKANSVRYLKRRFKRRVDGTIVDPRRYGQVDEGLDRLVPSEVSPNRRWEYQILTGLLTGNLSVSTNTLLSYYDEVQNESPDVLISLDGTCVFFSPEATGFTSAGLGKREHSTEIRNHFSFLVIFLYLWITYGMTAPFDSFVHYFRNWMGNRFNNGNPTA